MLQKNHPLANKHDLCKQDLADYPMYSCFSQSKQIQTMLNEAVDSLNKSSSIKVGSIEQVMEGLCKSNHVAISSIEHASSVAENSNLLQLKTNKSLAHEQLIVQTSQHVAAGEPINQLLSLIEKTALSINS